LELISLEMEYWYISKVCCSSWAAHMFRFSCFTGDSIASCPGFKREDDPTNYVSTHTFPGPQGPAGIRLEIIMLE
jgi:hypothetical protein